MKFSEKELGILGEQGENKTNLFFANLKVDNKVLYKGSFGKIQKCKIKIEQKTKSFAKKNLIHNNINPEEIIRQATIHRKLKESDILTFKTFLTSKEAIYSTWLNKKSKCALSINNNISAKHENIFVHKMEISNLKELFETAKKYAISASKNGLSLTEDSTFFLAKENHKGKPTKVKIAICDFDLVKEGDRLKNRSAQSSLSALRLSLESFVERYVKMELKNRYLDKIYEKFFPELENNQILTEKGEVKNIFDYNLKKDGEILNGKIVLNKLSTWEQIEKISKIPSAVTVLTKIKQEYKDKIIEWKGSLIDYSEEAIYKNLTNVGSNLVIGSKSFFANSLKEVGLAIYIEYAEKVQMKNLASCENLYIEYSPETKKNQKLNPKAEEKKGNLVLSDFAKEKMDFNS